MKVLFLTNIPSPYRVDFFNEMGKLSDLTVLYERKNANNRDDKWFKQKAETFKEVYLLGKKFYNDSALCFGVLTWLKDRSFDLIVVGGYSTPTGMLAIKYLKFKKISFILNCDGGMVKNESGFRYGFKKHLISKASAWLSTATSTDEYLIHYGANRDSIYHYPFTSLKSEDLLSNVLSKQKKLELREKLGLPTDKKIVLSIGQFVYRKGYDVLLKAWKLINEDSKLVIVGGGEKEHEYRQLIEANNLENVTIEGFKPKDIIFDYYKAADLFVLPTREDIWGLVINEAMACGLPVITTDRCVAGLELVKDAENGFIVSVGDEKQLAEKINIALLIDNLSTDMSKRSVEKIKQYTIEKMAEKHIEIFEKILMKE